MHRHTIDPLSAVLGLIAVGGGVIIAAGRADSLAINGVWWIAIVALLLGLTLVPWSRGTHKRAPEIVPDVQPDGGPLDESSTAPT